jgi:hypothetical protein
VLLALEALEPESDAPLVLDVPLELEDEELVELLPSFLVEL